MQIEASLYFIHSVQDIEHFKHNLNSEKRYDFTPTIFNIAQFAFIL